MKMFLKCFSVLLWMIGLTGFIFPFLVTLIGHLFLREQAEGSLTKIDNRIIGSLFFAQDFKSPRYFWPRPSASHYSLLPARGSQLNPASVSLAKEVAQRRAYLAEAHHKPPNLVPQDLLFASGSGLDPLISLEAALFQFDRVMKARNWDQGHQEKLIYLINESIEHNYHLFPGLPAVNVVKLNLILDEFEEEYKNERQ
jgi:potassium-transporting ATPase KdpC subunit